MDKLPLGTNLIDKKDIFNKIKMVKNIYLLEKSDIISEDNSLKFKLIDDKFTVLDDVIELNYWYQLKSLEFGYLLENCEKIFLPDKRFITIFDDDLSDKFFFYKNDIKFLPNEINQIHISDKIKHIEYQICNKFNFNLYNNNNQPTYIFGIYNRIDLSIVENHNNDIYIIFGGSDLDYNMFHCKVLIPKLLQFDNKIKKYYVISENLKNRAIQLKLPKNKIELIRLDLSEELNKIDKYNKSIYIYDGFGKIGKLYRRELVEKVLEILPIKFKTIFSSDLCIPPQEMCSVYQQCFIGLRLTEKDGNANTVIEMGKLGIPVIYNGNEINAISYNDYNDISNKIMDWYNLLEDLNMFD